jgi:hypothetical protein
MPSTVNSNSANNNNKIHSQNKLKPTNEIAPSDSSSQTPKSRTKRSVLKAPTVRITENEN